MRSTYVLHQTKDYLLMFRDRSYIHSSSTAAECENAIHPLVLETSLPQPDTARRFSVVGNNFRCQRSDGKLLASDLRLPATIGDSDHLGPFARTSTNASHRNCSVSRAAQEHLPQVCPGRGPECESKCVSSSKPFL